MTLVTIIRGRSEDSKCIVTNGKYQCLYEGLPVFLSHTE